MAWLGTTRAGKKARSAAHGARRRARERAARTEVRKLTLPELRDKFNGICQLCWCPVAEEEGSEEHTIPLSKGGKDDETNQTYAHAKCNSKKGNRTVAKRKGLRRSMWRRKPRTKIPEGQDVF